MPTFQLCHSSTGRSLARIDASTREQAVESYLTEHAHDDVGVAHITVYDLRVLREVSDRAAAIRVAMLAPTDGTLPDHCIIPHADGPVLSLVLEGKTLASFELKEPNGDGEGDGLLFGCRSWTHAVNFAFMTCCSPENRAGTPEVYFEGALFVPRTRRAQLRDTLTVVDAFVVAWERLRVYLERVATE
jgi:hypothetical protein